jgi:hypothetical protein
MFSPVFRMHFISDRRQPPTCSLERVRRSAVARLRAARVSVREMLARTMTAQCNQRQPKVCLLIVESVVTVAAMIWDGNCQCSASARDAVSPAYLQLILLEPLLIKHAILINMVDIQLVVCLK